MTINYRTGAVIAYVGSANYYGEATPAHQPQYDVVGQAYRQSGSAFKPITYATGFERGVDHARRRCSWTSRAIIAEGYIRPNADGNERGPVRVRDALKYSWNIPVAKAQQLIGTENVVDMAERLGLQWDPRQKTRWPSRRSRSGTLGVHSSTWPAAYGAIANGGTLAEPFLIEQDHGPRRQRHLRPRHGRRGAGAGPDRGCRLPGHRHPGRQHRPGHQLDLGPALPAPDR